MHTVLILGANGRLGQAATQAFSAAGWRVLAQLRRAPVAPLPAHVTALQCALADTVRISEQAAGARVVLHAVNPPYSRWEQEALPALQHGMAVAQRLGALFMLPGNVYNFGAHMPALLCPSTRQQPTTRSGRIRAAMEAAMQDRAAQGLRGVVIRAGDFFGCGKGSWLDQSIAKNIGRGRLVYPGPLDTPHAWAYLPDLARTFVAVANQALQTSAPAPTSTSSPASTSMSASAPAPALDVIHFAGHTLTGRQLLAALAQAATDLGLRPKNGFTTSGLPWALIRALGLVRPDLRELARLSYLWRVPHALDGTRLSQRVALPPATPLHLALEHSLLDLGLVQRAAPPLQPV